MKEILVERPVGKEYLIKWKGYGCMVIHTWEPVENIASFGRIIEKFQKDKQVRSKHKNATSSVGNVKLA